MVVKDDHHEYDFAKAIDLGHTIIIDGRWQTHPLLRAGIDLLTWSTITVLKAHNA